eukprot:8647686-Ditylum_brightwellii.AAC.1
MPWLCNFQFQPPGDRGLPGDQEEKEKEMEITDHRWEKWRDQVMVQKNQTINHVNKESCNQQSAFKQMPAGLFIFLGRLTSMTYSDENSPIMD